MASSLATLPVNSHKNISTEALWCGLQTACNTPCNWQHNCFLFYCYISLLAARQALKPLDLWSGNALRAFQDKPAQMFRSNIGEARAAYPPESVGGAGTSEGNLLPSCGSCQTFIFCFLFCPSSPPLPSFPKNLPLLLLLGASVPAGSCLVLMAKSSVQLCVEKYACSILYV